MRRFKKSILQVLLFGDIIHVKAGEPTIYLFAAYPPAEGSPLAEAMESESGEGISAKIPEGIQLYASTILAPPRYETRALAFAAHERGIPQYLFIN